MTVLYVILAILAFGFLIFIHEAGHYIFARIFKVTVNEFSIGMGPAIFSKVSKKTQIKYSIRALPIGGYVSMAGEDEESDDPNAFNKKPVWQRFIITFAGAFTNLLIGFIVTAVLVCSSPDLLGTNIVAEFKDNAASEAAGLCEGDRIVKVDGADVHIADDLMYEIMRKGIEPIDLTVIRDGEEKIIENVEFPQISEQGVAFGMYDFYVYRADNTVLNLCKQSFWKCCYNVRMIWESLYDLVSGRYGVQAVSGPVGVTKALTDAAETGSYNFITLVTLISINLGVMNLLPLPALDGGRLVMLVFEGITKKKISPKIEGAVNGAGLVILLLLMAVICVKDVVGLF